MEHLIEVLGNSILLYLIFLRINSGRNQSLFQIGFPIALGIYTVIFVVFEDPLYTTFLFELILYFLLPCILLKGSSKKVTIQTSLIVIGLTTLIGSVVVAFTNAFLSNQAISKLVFITFNAVVIALLIVAIYSQKIYTYLYELFTLSNSSRLVILAFIWELVLLVSTQAAFLRMDTSIRITVLTGIVLIMVLLGSSVLVHFLITNDMKKQYYQRINKNLEQAMHEEIRHYEQLKQSYESVRKFRHDFNNIIIGLRSILNQNDVEGAQQYLKRCNSLLNETEPIIQTGHPVVNSLLSDKLQTVKDHSINIKFNGHIAYDVMDPVDLCIVFGNVVDNAIEACQKIPAKQEKEITISARIVKDIFFVKSTNPTKEDVEISNPLTTKDDIINHGIGLYNIRSIVQKYGGHMQIACADKIFTIELGFAISANHVEV